MENFTTNLKSLGINCIEKYIQNSYCTGHLGFDKNGLADHKNGNPYLKMKI